MFGASSSLAPAADEEQSATPTDAQKPPQLTIPTDSSSTAGGEKRASGTTSPSGRKSGDEASAEKKRRSSSVAKARDILSSAKQSLYSRASSPSPSPSPPSRHSSAALQRLSKADPSLGVPQGSLNNSAGESAPSPSSTFRVGVTEDKNRKCRRTMEDTHAYLYNFLGTPSPVAARLASAQGKEAAPDKAASSAAGNSSHPETDNGYFAIFDGHAGSFAADWCGKKLHLLLEENIRKNPKTAIPELLDHTFTVVDQQLEKLPVKNSGCTAVTAVLRWEDRVPDAYSITGSSAIGPAIAKAAAETASLPPSLLAAEQSDSTTSALPDAAGASPYPTHDRLAEARIKDSLVRQRVLYTANVGDARIVLCRNGKALRLSYDHKGSDENEGKRVSNAGGLILNNRVNGVLAVTRALGDSYMKELVTGHPYTTETVIQSDQDEFLILACDGVRLPQLFLPTKALTSILEALGRLLRPGCRRFSTQRPGPSSCVQSVGRPCSGPLLDRQPLLYDCSILR